MGATAAHNERQSAFERLLEWREKHLSEKTFTLMLAFAVGLFCAVAAYALHWIIEQVAALLTSSFNERSANWPYLVYPVVGIFVTSLFVRYVVKDNISHGITRCSRWTARWSCCSSAAARQAPSRAYSRRR